MTEEHPNIEDRRRMLNISIPAPTNFVRQGDGLIIKNVPALASGEWTDSNVQKPLFYPTSTLEKYATNWQANGVWTRHTGGAPRAITEKIGTIKEPRYASEAAMVDIHLHGRTQASRDVIALVESGETTDVSVEHGGVEQWNPETKRYEAVSLAFYGLAHVDRGACEVCKLPRRNEEPGHISVQVEEPKSEQKEERRMGEPEDAEKKALAAIEVEKAELTKKLEASSKSLVEEQSAHKTEVEELTKKLAEAEARIKELAKLPATPKTLAGNGSGTPQPIVQLEVISPARCQGGEVSRT